MARGTAAGPRLYHMTVHRCLLLGLLLALPACSAAPSEQVSVSGSPRPATSPTILRTDRVGNVLPPVASEPDWTRLAARPIQLGNIDSGAACPLSTTAELAPATAALAGPGPVYPAGNRIPVGAKDADGFSPGKVLWVARPDYAGPALIRGRRIDGIGELRFLGRVTGELRFPLETGVRAGASEQGWRYLPSTVYVSAPGCYGFQIDGVDWTITIVMATADGSGP
jgi:hypothetical protein